MDNKQAIAIAAKLRGHFEAFKHLEDLFQHIATTDNLIVEQKALLARLGPEIAEAQTKLTTLQEQFRVQQTELGKKLTQRQAAADTKIAELDKLLAGKAAYVQEQITECGRLHAQVMQKQAEELAAAVEKRTALDYEVAALKDQLQKLKAKIGAL